MIINARFLLAFVSLFVFSADAAAYRYRTCLGEKINWNSTHETLRLNSGSFPVGSAWHAALATAVSRFNQNPSQFTYAITHESGSVGIDNGQNEVWMSDGEFVTGVAIAATHVTTCYWFFGSQAHYDEVDLVFRTRPGFPYAGGWSTSESKQLLRDYGGTRLSAPMVAVHELGHGIGLLHETRSYNSLNGNRTHLQVNGSLARAYVGENVSVGALFLYGQRNPLVHDVGVTHWRYLAESPDTGDHVKTRLYDTANVPLPGILADGSTTTIFRVTAGQPFRTEFTYENNGAAYEPIVDVGFYISTNDFISTYDTRIGGRTLTLGPNTVYTRRHTITIPSTVPPGDYWLGAIVDEEGMISENAEWNNATYIPIRVMDPVPNDPPTEPPPFPVFDLQTVDAADWRAVD